MRRAAGTDNRSSTGYYSFPEGIVLPEGIDPRPLPSVTTVISMISDFQHAQAWWGALEVNELAQAAKSKEPVRMWHKHRKEMVEVHPGQILLNALPEDFGSNAGLHWLKGAGARELERRANRGQVVHDAVNDFVLGDLRVSRSDLGDYAGSLIEGRGYALKVEYCMAHIWSALSWLDRYLGEPRAAETAVVNFEYGYAGTVDLESTLRNCDVPPSALCQIDFKTSQKPYPEHRIQASAYFKCDWALLRRYGVDGLFKRDRPDRVLNVYVQEDHADVFEFGQDSDLFSEAGSLDDAFAAFAYLLAVFHYQQRSTGSPDALRSLKLVHPAQGDIISYRDRNLNLGEHHEQRPTLILAEGGAPSHPRTPTDGDQQPRPKRRKAAPKV